MATIAPFKGVHYDPDLVSISDVIAPPYDVLSPAQQDAYYALHPENIVRLMLNKDQPEDSETSNRYTRAAEFLQQALQAGILVADSESAYYEYIQKFEHPLDFNQIVERKTLFVALKLAPYAEGIVLPHEETHPKAKADRLNLMRATRSNPEPIYGLYEDPEMEVAKALDESGAGSEPLLVATFAGKSGSDAEQHLIYRHAGASIITKLNAFFEPRRVWIADGHHRYETALNYQAETTAAGKSSPKSEDFLLIGLSAFEDPGLVVLPTHRLVKNVSPGRFDDLLLQLKRYFNVQMIPIDEARAWIKQEVAGEKRIVIIKKGACYALTLLDLAVAEAAMQGSHCAAWKRLDVTILQMLVLDRSLGISWTSLAHTHDIAYTRDEQEAVDRVLSGEFQLACLLQNPAVDEVRDVASAGDKMPQKSTFFYPKLWSGLILRLFESR